MKKLLINLKKYRKECILAPMFKLLEASFELVVPLVVASLIDKGIMPGDEGHVVKMVLVLVGLGLVGYGFSVTAQFFAAKAAVGFATGLRSELFSHIMRLSMKNMGEQGASTLITRMTSDINQVQSGVNMTLRLFLRSPFIVFGAMIMAFTVDVKAAMIFVIIIPILFLVVFALMKVTVPKQKDAQASLDKVLGLTRENLTGVRVIRAFGLEEEEIEHFENETSALRRLQETAGKISAVMNPLTYILINGALIILLYSGAIRVEAGSVTGGAVVALVNYLSQILVELIKLANLCVTITKAIACGNRIESVMEIPEGMEDSSDIKTGDENNTETGTGKNTDELQNTEYSEKDGDSTAVEFKHVYMKYSDGGEAALEDISFSVNAGETVGIIGGTGSGKTSVVSLIPRFYDVCDTDMSDPSQKNGGVYVFGKDVREYDLSLLRSKVGTVLQKAVLFKGTIRDNLKWGNGDASDEELLEAAAAAQAMDVIEKKEGGLDAAVEQEGRNFSGGQKQRLSIARTLVKKPEILILDDSSSALDYATDAALRSSLRKLSWKPTVFIVSQRTTSIMHADRILVMDDGCIVGEGTHEKLLESCGIYREIHETSQK